MTNNQNTASRNRSRTPASGPRRAAVPVRVPGGRYTAIIGPQARRELPDILSGLRGAHRSLIITDETVAALHGSAIAAHVPNAAVVAVPAGERSKSLRAAETLYDHLAAARMLRGDVLIALGGGMIGDLTGFVAGTWMRGMRFVQMPTTTEAAVDASVGGKTGVNHPAGKNLIGVFHQPSAVVIDTDLLATLPDRDHAAGLAESVKHAVIRDPRFLAWHESRARQIAGRHPETLARLIARNCRIKAGVVALDEREAGIRAILNYGHTIGHALEHVLGFELRHGECVALGMIAENAIAVGRQAMRAADARRVADVLAALGLPTRLPRVVAAGDVIEACRLDKKSEGDAVHFVLVAQFGAAQRVVNVQASEIAAALEAIQP